MVKISAARYVSVLVIGLGLFLNCSMRAQTGQTAADNTKQNDAVNNKRSEGTADKGALTTSDTKLIAEIRRAVVKDKSLSTYGHNVKILALNGKVTLKGAVHTDDEKKAIEDHARKIAGDANVTNELSVKGDQK